MKQLVLVLVVAAVAAAPADDTPAEFAVPCNDDGLAHIPDLPDGASRPYSVRKRSRTVHRDSQAVTDDTPQLPPGQRRFDAVLPDEQGHDITSSTPSRTQRRLSFDASNEVAAERQEQPGLRRPTRRPARPRKVVEENYPVNHPAFAEHDAKSDAVVDSYEKVRRYPTHLPTEEGEDDNLTGNDVLPVVANAADQVALEDVASVSTEQRDNGVPESPDLPPAYRSKFPKRTFASDAGGAGDVLRVKPRKGTNQYQPQQQHEGLEEIQASVVPEAELQHQRRPRPRPPPAQHPEEEQLQHQRRPRPRPPPAQHPEEEQLQHQRRPRPRPPPAQHPEEEQLQYSGAADDAAEDAAPSLGPTTRGRQRYRASQRVRAEGGEEVPQRRQPARRRLDAASEDIADAPQPVRHRPQPRPRPSQPADIEEAVEALQEQPKQRPVRPVVRRRPRPRPSTTPEPTNADDNSVHDNTVAPTTPTSLGGRSQAPQQRPLRRRPRPTAAAVEEVEVEEDLREAVQKPQRRRRPQQAAAGQQAVSEESVQVHAEQGARGHGRKLQTAARVQNRPEVQVMHDGTAVDEEGHTQEPTLVRSAVKKVPSGGYGGDPSPALIQKIVKNTLRRLKPQIAEHEGDVGVDILVKIIQVEDR